MVAGAVDGDGGAPERALDVNEGYGIRAAGADDLARVALEEEVEGLAAAGGVTQGSAGESVIGGEGVACDTAKFKQTNVNSSILVLRVDATSAMTKGREKLSDVLGILLRGTAQVHETGHVPWHNGHALGQLLELRRPEEAIQRIRIRKWSCTGWYWRARRAGAEAISFIEGVAAPAERYATLVRGRWRCDRSGSGGGSGGLVVNVRLVNGAVWGP